MLEAILGHKQWFGCTTTLDKDKWQVCRVSFHWPQGEYTYNSDLVQAMPTLVDGK